MQKEQKRKNTSIIKKEESKKTSSPNNPMNKNKLPIRGIPNGEYKSPNGDKRVMGPDGTASVDEHWSHPEHHLELSNPHYHDWDWPDDPDGDPVFGPAYNIETGTKVVATGITLYGIYLIVKWGVAYATATPTGGGSLIIAGMTP